MQSRNALSSVVTTYYLEVGLARCPVCSVGSVSDCLRGMEEHGAVPDVVDVAPASTAEVGLRQQLARRITTQAPMPGFVQATTHARCFSFPLHSAAVDTHVCHRVNTTRKWRRDRSPL